MATNNSIAAWNARFLTITQGGLHALISVPQGDTPEDDERWPLILFLHGRGPSGDDLASLLQEGLPALLAEFEDFPFVVVCPQCGQGRDWSHYQDDLLALLDDVLDAFPVDRECVYLTGLSMGGRGTWQLAVEHPERFAAIAPICGRVPDLPDFFERLPALRTMPVWVFHGARDEIIPIENSDRIVAALAALGNEVRYKIYPEAGHDAWTATYSNPELYEWLLGHRL
jgi:predicted peptidase